MSGLYAIYDRAGLADDALARVEAVLAAGADWLQYRDKRERAPDRALIGRLRALTRAAGARLIINDDWQLAAETGADGVHIGQTDGAVADARTALGQQAIIGVSCSGSLEHAERAARDGASYVSFGRFFDSATKPDAAPATLDVLAGARRLGIPVVAIGGINATNAQRVAAAGADRIAVAGALFKSADPGAAARELCALLSTGQRA